MDKYTYSHFLFPFIIPILLTVTDLNKTLDDPSFPLGLAFFSPSFGLFFSFSVRYRGQKWVGGEQAWRWRDNPAVHVLSLPTALFPVERFILLVFKWDNRAHIFLFMPVSLLKEFEMTVSLVLLQDKLGTMGKSELGLVFLM